MDFEFAAWLMFYMFVAPQKVFRNFKYRKHAMSQLLRDSPAFLILFSVWLLLSSVWFALVVGLRGGQLALFVVALTLLDVVGTGVLASTFLWYTCSSAATSAPAVRWRFAFPAPLAMLRCLQVLLLEKLLVHVGFFSCLVSNILWLICIINYTYITILGYSAALSVSGVRWLAWAVLALLVVYLASLGVQLCVGRWLETLRPHLL